MVSFLLIALNHQVTYQADHFLDKNKDYVVAEHQALLNASKCYFVANLFPPLPEESSKQSKFSSIGTRFKVKAASIVAYSSGSYSFKTITYYFPFTATTTSSYGNIEYYRTTLY